MRPLNQKEKGQICMLARRAWENWARDEWSDGVGEELNKGVRETVLFRAWRMKEQHFACGIQSLTLCTINHYPALMAHFSRLVGDDKQEQYWTARLVNDPRNVALHKLQENCRKFDLHYPDYPGSICRRQFKCSLAGASVKQIWSLVYTVRNRGRAKARKLRNADCGSRKGATHGK